MMHTNPLYLAVDDEFKTIISELTKQFNHLTTLKKGRVFHKLSTTALGTLSVYNQLAIPKNKFLTAGKTYSILLRHANGTQTDDAAPDNRGATLRILTSETPLDFQNAQFDLLLSTGQCFLSRSAKEFYEWSKMSVADRNKVAMQYPHLSQAAWEMYRETNSYTDLHYYSKVAYHYITEGGLKLYARFRLIPQSRSEDTGFIDASSSPLPNDIFPRDVNDKRPKDYLHQDLKDKILNSEACYIFQIQLRPLSDIHSNNEAALDCTRIWPETEFPWKDIGEIQLNEIISNEKIENLGFNPARTPHEIAFIMANTPDESASLNHVRALVYGAVSNQRGSTEKLNVSTPSQIQKNSDNKKNICVIGAGPSGIYTAYALSQCGYTVTLFEKEAEIGGKSQAICIEGKYYDLGAHVCTQHYHLTSELAKKFNLATELSTPSLIYDIESKKILLSDSNGNEIVQSTLKYRTLKQAHFDDLSKPGYTSVEKKLSMPIQEWLQNQGLSAIKSVLEMPFTASGYGFFEDNDLPILYLLKFADHGSLSSKSSTLPMSWTIKDGFIQLWNALAATLQDVRCHTEISYIKRDDTGVTLYIGKEAFHYDKLILASPLDQALEFLDASSEEREIFSNIIYFDYYTIVCEIENLPRNGFYLIKQHCQSKQTMGHMVSFHHRYKDSAIYTCYSYGNESQDEEDIIAYLKDDITRMGGTLKKIHFIKKWDYFPHFNKENLASAYYEKLEKLQGKRNTYFVGGLLNFELIEPSLAYAKNIVDKFFQPKIMEEKKDMNQGTTLSLDNIILELKNILAESLHIDQKLLKKENEILALGLDSIVAANLFRQLGDKFNITLEPNTLFEYPTIEAFAKFILSQENAALKAPEKPKTPISTTSSATNSIKLENLLNSLFTSSPNQKNYTQITNCVYLEHQGAGLLIDVLLPVHRSNKIAIMDVVSALWTSERQIMQVHQNTGMYDYLTQQGYTVFVLRPGSHTQFTGHEMIQNVKRAIMWVKHHHQKFNIDKEKIALFGGSSGAQLALCAALNPTQINSDIDYLDGKYNSDIHAVVCFSPIVNARWHYNECLNAIKKSAYAFSQHNFYFEIFQGLLGLNKKESLRLNYLDDTLKELSPIENIGNQAINVLIFHGSNDEMVSLESVQQFCNKLIEHGYPTKLNIVDTGQHGIWNNFIHDIEASEKWLSQIFLNERLYN